MTNELAERQPLTPAIYDDEKWDVKVDRDSFTLTGKQVKALKQATVNGERGLMWFGEFAISIPHIQSIKRTQKTKKEAIEKVQATMKKLGMA